MNHYISLYLAVAREMAKTDPTVTRYTESAPVFPPKIRKRLMAELKRFGFLREHASEESIRMAKYVGTVPVVAIVHDGCINFSVPHRNRVKTALSVAEKTTRMLAGKP